MPDNKQKRKAGNRKVVPKTAWKPGQSGNLKGAPKRGMSIKEAYDWALRLNAEDMAAILAAGGNNELAEAFRRMPKGIELKTLWAARVLSAVMFEPQPGLVNHVVERLEGKVSQPIETWQDRVIALLKDGKVTGEQVEDEFGADIATNLVIAAGLSNGASGETGTAGGEEKSLAD